MTAKFMTRFSTNNQYMTMGDYVVLNGVVEIDDRYTQMEAARVMADTNHSGPWRDVNWVPDTEEYRKWVSDGMESMKKTNAAVQRRLRAARKS
jgi:hypothetical protein